MGTLGNHVLGISLGELEHLKLSKILSISFFSLHDLQRYFQK